MGKEIVLLSGMHRSGTSALARVCSLLGAVLPEPLAHPAMNDDPGWWEPLEVVNINERALREAGAHINSLHPLPADWAESSAAEALSEEIAAYLHRAAPEGAVTVITDPRISLLASCWRAAVERTGATPRFVLAFRDPREVFRSLSSRQLHSFPHEAWPQTRVTALWLTRQLQLEHDTRGAVRSFVDHAGLLADWRAQARRMYGQLDLAWIEPTSKVTEIVDALVRPGAGGQRRKPNESALPLASALLSLLRRAEQTPAGLTTGFDAAGDRLRRALETAVGADEGADSRTVIAALMTADETRRGAQAATGSGGAQAQGGRQAESAGSKPNGLRDRADLDVHRSLEAALRAQVLADDLQQTRQHVSGLESERALLLCEIADHRDAYEALRVEAAATRARAEILAKWLEQLQRARLEAGAALTATRAEVAALRNSRSWRMTRLFRSVTFRLRRLVR